MTSRRTIEIGSYDAVVTLKHRQLTIRRDGEIAGQIPTEDIGLLLIDAPGTTYTHSALVEIITQGGLVVLCGADHLPAALVVPVDGHSLVRQRFQIQLETTEPRKKRIWQEIVRAKLRNQAAACEHAETSSRLRTLAERVRSGDPENIEAQAARLYWAQYLPPDAMFRRDRDGPAPNNFLNYGYAVVRAAVARSLYAAGLNPMFGLYHTNRGNAFGLADDLMEAFRPWVDLAARTAYREGRTELTRDVKAALLGVLYARCRSGRIASTSLQVAADRTAFALVSRLSGESNSPLPLPLLDGLEVNLESDLDDAEPVQRP